MQRCGGAGTGGVIGVEGGRHQASRIKRQASSVEYQVSELHEEKPGIKVSRNQSMEVRLSGKGGVGWGVMGGVGWSEVGARWSMLVACDVNLEAGRHP